MIYKIYRITDNTNGNCYVGQTIQELKERICKHKSNFKTGYGSCSSELILKNNDWKYELIEETDDITREKYWIHNSTNCINTHRLEGRNMIHAREMEIEYRKKNKDILKEYYKTYRENNADKVKKWNKKNNDVRNRWYSVMGGNPSKNNMSLLKISPDVFK